MMRTEEENAEGAKLLQQLRAIVDRIAGTGGVAIEEIQRDLKHHSEAQRIVQQLHDLGFTDSEIERNIFR